MPLWDLPRDIGAIIDLQHPIDDALQRAFILVSETPQLIVLDSAGFC